MSGVETGWPPCPPCARAPAFIPGTRSHKGADAATPALQPLTSCTRISTSHHTLKVSKGFY